MTQINPLKGSLQLRDKDQRRLLTIIEQHLPSINVWAYGSRVNGRSHAGSDLDLVLRSLDLTPIDLQKLISFNAALTESDIPILIDAKDWAKLPDSFHQEINKSHVLLYQAPANKEPALAL